MRISKATKKYEAWVRKHAKLLAEDLALKHQHMAEDPFPFLRATFYRWAQVWPEVCPDLAKAPKVLAVGDLHVENFGTWRDADGRLIWGVNDFDEVYPMSYANDLVRLAVSAHLAIAANHLAVATEEACQAILEGYADGLEKGGMPFVLEEHHAWLREVAMSELRHPVAFWAKMESLETFKGDVPKGARKALEGLLPERGLPYRLAHRIAGLGSLGRERYVALGDWHGGNVAREAKKLIPSGYVWAGPARGNELLYEQILQRAVRVRDPFVHLRGTWIVRRLAPHCSRIELSSLPRRRDETRLLQAMGFETANIHLGSQKAVRAVRADLKKRHGAWLHSAVKAMEKATRKDWEDWREAFRSKGPRATA